MCVTHKIVVLEWPDGGFAYQAEKGGPSGSGIHLLLSFAILWRRWIQNKVPMWPLSTSCLSLGPLSMCPLAETPYWDGYYLFIYSLKSAIMEFFQLSLIFNSLWVISRTISTGKFGWVKDVVFVRLGVTIEW